MIFSVQAASSFGLMYNFMWEGRKILVVPMNKFLFINFWTISIAEDLGSVYPNNNIWAYPEKFRELKKLKKVEITQDLLHRNF